MNKAGAKIESQNALADLEQLLLENPADAARRAATQFDLAGTRLLALYGAGNLGRHLLAGLRTIGVEPIAFADDTAGKQGSTIDGLAVMSPAEVVERFGPDVVFAVTVFSPAASYLQMRRRLREQVGARVVSFLSLMWASPDVFLPYYQFVLPQDVLKEAAAIREAFAVLADDESRRQFVGQLRHRLWLDFRALPPSSKGNYFPVGVVPELPPETTFVDCGAFDGDTVRQFINHQRGVFHEIYAFEPDPENCRRLKEYAGSLGEHVAQRIHVHEAAAGARRERSRFSSSGNTGAALNQQGTSEVEVLPVSEVVDGGNADVLYLKFDVEGAEADALSGAEELIKLRRPIVALSVYHKPFDLWQLPTRLQALDPVYRIHLRTQGEDGMDVVCYAIPRVDEGVSATARLSSQK